VAAPRLLVSPDLSGSIRSRWRSCPGNGQRFPMLFATTLEELVSDLVACGQSRTGGRDGLDDQPRLSESLRGGMDGCGPGERGGLCSDTACNRYEQAWWPAPQCCRTGWEPPLGTPVDAIPSQHLLVIGVGAR
jgi:hypothetical protein